MPYHCSRYHIWRRCRCCGPCHRCSTWWCCAFCYVAIVVNATKSLQSSKWNLWPAIWPKQLKDPFVGPEFFCHGDKLWQIEKEPPSPLLKVFWHFPPLGDGRASVRLPPPAPDFKSFKISGKAKDFFENGLKRFLRKIELALFVAMNGWRGCFKKGV